MTGLSDHGLRLRAIRAAVRCLGAGYVAMGTLFTVYGYAFYEWTWWNRTYLVTTIITGLSLVFLKRLGYFGAWLVVGLLIYGYGLYNPANWNRIRSSHIEVALALVPAILLSLPSGRSACQWNRPYALTMKGILLALLPTVAVTLALFGIPGPFTHVTGRIVVTESREPVPNTCIAIEKGYDHRGLIPLVNVLPAREVRVTASNRTGAFDLRVINRHHKYSKYRPGEFSVSKEGYVPFFMEFSDVSMIPGTISLQPVHAGFPLPQGRVYLDNQGPRCFFSFSQGRLVDSQDQADLILSRLASASDEFASPRWSLTTEGDGGIAVARQEDENAFVALGTAEGLSFLSEVPDHSTSHRQRPYVVRTRDGRHYGKVLVNDLGLSWVYQPDGTTDLGTPLFRPELAALVRVHRACAGK